MFAFKKVMLPLAGIALLLSSCTKEDVQEAAIAGMGVEATFTTPGPAGFRATGSSWEAGDIVGIYALKAGMPLAAGSVYDGKENIAYQNSVEGSSAIFTAVVNPIRFPGDGSALDFVAYYPYSNNVSSNYIVAIDLSQQSPLSAIDLMHATVSGQSKANTSVPLTFSHSLSKYQLILTTDEGLSLSGATLTIDNVLTQGSMDLATGNVTADNVTGSITPVMTIDETANSAVATAILLPGQETNAMTVHIQLADGKQYHWIPSDETLLAGSSNSYSLNLTAGDTDPGNGPKATDLFISEYIEGSSNNKYIEIFNGTGEEVNLTGYRVVLYSNGATTPGNTLELTGTLTDKGVVVISNASATLYSGEATSSTITYFNGDDALALEKSSDGGVTYIVVDIFGCIGEDPGSSWTADGGYSTTDKTLRRKSSIHTGVAENPTAGFPTLATEWDLFEKDDASGLGSHTME